MRPMKTNKYNDKKIFAYLLIPLPEIPPTVKHLSNHAQHNAESHLASTTDN